MREAAFVELLAGLLPHGIRRVDAGLRDEQATVEEEVARLRATTAVTCTLRRCHRTREASVAAHRASEAVLAAAGRAGMTAAERATVTRVARAAADLARAMVAAEAGRGDKVLPVVLSAPWRDVLQGRAAL